VTPPSKARVGDYVRVLRSWSRGQNPNGVIYGQVVRIHEGARGNGHWLHVLTDRGIRELYVSHRKSSSLG